MAPTLPSPPNVEAVERNGKQATFLLLLNHGEEPAAVTLDGPGRDLLTGRRPSGDIVLDPLGVAILQTGPETPT